MMEIECLARIGARNEKFALEGQYQEIMQGFREKEYQERLIIMNLTTIEKKKFTALQDYVHLKFNQ